MMPRIFQTWHSMQSLSYASADLHHYKKLELIFFEEILQIIGPKAVDNETLQRNYWFMSGLCLTGLLLLFLALGGFVTVFFFWIFLFFAVVLLSGSGLFFRKIILIKQNNSNHEKLIASFSSKLDDAYIYFRNLILAGRALNGSIDGILLGPNGALVIKVANLTGTFICEGDNWYKFTGGVNRLTKEIPDKFRRRLNDSPTWHAIRATREIKSWLSVRNLPQVSVQPLVVLSQGKIHSAKRPGCPVVELWHIESFLKDNFLPKYETLIGEQLTSIELEQIAERLKG